MGYSFGEEKGDSQLDNHRKDLTDFPISYRQIYRAINADTFLINHGDNKIVEYPMCDAGTFYHYFDIFENCDYFGMPHGKGWVHEAEWLLKVFKALKRIKRKYYSEPSL